MLNNLIMGYGKNAPIFLSDILKNSYYSRSRVNQLIKEYIDKGKLVRFSDGVFYIPSKTVLDNSVLDIRKVVDKKYIKDAKDVFGIYGGISLLNAFGFTMQVPNVYEIVTNNESTRVREIQLNGQKIILRKSRFQITKDNYKIYMLLELFNQFDKDEIINADKIVKFVKSNKLEYKEIMKYMNYFPAKVSKNFNRSEIIYAII